jgi:hypothetical protein
VLLMQYWLIDYEATCPPTWTPYGSDCYADSNIQLAPVLNISKLGQLVLTARTYAGTVDTVLFSWGNGLMSAVSGPDSMLNLQGGWNSAEFNVFGDGGGSQAMFNSGSTIVVRTNVDNLTLSSPTCPNDGYTGEKNNLSLVRPCCIISGDSPAILFTESNSTNARSACSCPSDSTWIPSRGACICDIPGQVLTNGKCEAPQSTSACGGSATIPMGHGEGPQPGQNCPCSGGKTGRYYCTAAKVLSCDCAN